jgi:hypothetical protein
MPWSTDSKAEAIRHLLMHLAAGDYTAAEAYAFAVDCGLTNAQIRTALTVAQTTLQNQLEKLATMDARLAQMGA